MRDEDIIHHIDELAGEERRLHERGADGQPLGDGDRKRLGEIDVHLDVLWDLLRQRRALRSAGQDPDHAVPRDAGVVEGYRQ